MRKFNNNFFIVVRENFMFGYNFYYLRSKYDIDIDYKVYIINL